MAVSVTKRAVPRDVDDLDLLIEGFELSLQAANKSPKTIDTYREAARQFSAFLDEMGMPREPRHIRREHVEAWVVSLLGRWKPATASNRFRALQQFFKFLVEEGEVQDSPLAHMRPPMVPVDPPPVLGLQELQKMLAACRGDRFEELRDTAILRLFMTTGARLAEAATLQVTDVVIARDLRFVQVLGKGRKRRNLPLDNKTARSLNRYLRERSRRPGAHETDALWLGHRGPMTVSGVQQVVRRRGREAGLGEVNPHALRHSFAHSFLRAGGQESDLMQLAGWSSRAMVERYGAALRSERAHEAHRRLGIGDRL